jgi:hypothetical protein
LRAAHALAWWRWTRKTIDYVKGRLYAGTDAATGKFVELEWDQAGPPVHAAIGCEREIRRGGRRAGRQIIPQVAGARRPEMVLLTAVAPDPEKDPGKGRRHRTRADLHGAGQGAQRPVCRQGVYRQLHQQPYRRHDAAANVKKSWVRKSPKRQADVPGSGLVKEQAEQEGLT